MRGRISGLAARLKQLREARSLTQKELADYAQTHSDSIVKLEMGRRLPTLELAWRLATVLGVSVNDLLPSRYHPEVPPPARQQQEKREKYPPAYPEDREPPEPERGPNAAGAVKKRKR
jgi:putative transcriptional regulator